MLSLAVCLSKHVNILITEPGTLELDWSELHSFTSETFRLPDALKYTPKGATELWGRTEYSLAFDTLTNDAPGDSRMTQFSQTLALTATAILHDGEKLDMALAPQAVFFLRDESGVRVGATAIARYDTGRNCSRR